MKKLAFTVILLLLAMTLSACAEKAAEAPEAPQESMTEQQDAVIAQKAGGQETAVFFNAGEEGDGLPENTETLEENTAPAPEPDMEDNSAEVFSEYTSGEWEDFLPLRLFYNSVIDRMRLSSIVSISSSVVSSACDTLFEMSVSYDKNVQFKEDALGVFNQFLDDISAYDAYTSLGYIEMYTSDLDDTIAMLEDIEARYPDIGERSIYVKDADSGQTDAAEYEEDYTEPAFHAYVPAFPYLIEDMDARTQAVNLVGFDLCMMNNLMTAVESFNKSIMLGNREDAAMCREALDAIFDHFPNNYFLADLGLLDYYEQISTTAWQMYSYFYAYYESGSYPAEDYSWAVNALDQVREELIDQFSITQEEISEVSERYAAQYH